MCNSLHVQKPTPHIGVAVREARQGAGLSIERLAAKSGVSVRTIINVEQGASSPRYDVVERLAEGLGLSVAELAS